MQDLSSLAKNAITVTSQEGGGLIHDNSPAMTAPGSTPATPQPKADVQSDPTLDVGTARPVGTAKTRRVHDTSYSPTTADWRPAERRG